MQLQELYTNAHYIRTDSSPASTKHKLSELRRGSGGGAFGNNKEELMVRLQE
jgi:hypothetical protein